MVAGAVWTVTASCWGRKQASLVGRDHETGASSHKQNIMALCPVSPRDPSPITRHGS